MSIFIAGTDTGVGKTFVTAAVCTALMRQGLEVGVQKWITTGSRNESGDMEFVRAFVRNVLGERAARELLCSAPYCFSFPASPHLASALDGMEIDTQEILREYRKMESQSEVLLVEGTGGVMVPVTRDVLYVDLIEKIRPVIILVARSGLGTINHTLLTIEALRARGFELLCVILNPVNFLGEEDDTSTIIVQDNKEIISELGDVEVFGPMPFTKDFLHQEIWANIQPVVRMIEKLQEE